MCFSGCGFQLKAKHRFPKQLKPKVVVTSLADKPEHWLSLKEYFKKRGMYHEAAELLREIATRPRADDLEANHGLSTNYSLYPLSVVVVSDL